MGSIQFGSGNELFYHGSALLKSDGAKLDLDGGTAKYFVCAITILADGTKFQVLNTLDGGVNLGLGNTHFISTEDTATLDTDWGAETNESDNDSPPLEAGANCPSFDKGITIYGMWDNVELHAGLAICYVAPRPDYRDRSAAIS